MWEWALYRLYAHPTSKAHCTVTQTTDQKAVHTTDVTSANASSRCCFMSTKAAGYHHSRPVRCQGRLCLSQRIGQLARKTHLALEGCVRVSIGLHRKVKCYVMLHSLVCDAG